jgi:uncharacterized protein
MTNWQSTVRRGLATSLVDRVPRDHDEPAPRFQRRRIVVAVTLVLGAVLLGISLSIRPGNSLFYLFTLAVAAVWTVGGLLSGPLHLGYIPVRGVLRRPVLSPVLVGLLAGAVFLVGALVVREIPPLRDYVDNVLAHARRGSIVPITVVTAANGIAEEIFFRGALFAAIGRRYPVPICTGVYAVATMATGNPMLVFAAVTVGLVLALQRRASGGVLAPILTHVSWSLLMLYALPALF